MYIKLSYIMYDVLLAGYWLLILPAVDFAALSFAFAFYPNS